MYTLVACWSAPKPEDEAAFEEHYRSVHLPAAAKVPGLRKLLAVRTADGLEGGQPAFYRVAVMSFDSQEELEASERAPEWEAMRADAGSMIQRFGVSLTVGMGDDNDGALQR